jgi:pimeloyl-ACP methyl ester carboxylesterase
MVDLAAGWTLSHQVVGNGPNLVLVHGLAGSSKWWARNIEALARTNRVYAVDLAGFGATERIHRFRLEDAASVLIDWLDRHDIESTAIAGHSMGGLISARVAADAPERIHRLALIDAAFLSLDLNIVGVARGLIDSARQAPWDLLDLVARDSMRADPISLTRATFEVLTVNWHAMLDRITAPTLIVWGERDTLVPVTIAELLAASLPHAELVIIPGAGHVPMWDQPDLFNDALLGFLTRADKHRECVSG